MVAAPGWLALDIDGTITPDKYSIPHEVVEYLHSLQRKGWNVMVLTGRSFSYAHRAVSFLNFPYFIAVQNGSLILQMPDQKALAKRYMQAEILGILDRNFKGLKGNYLVYSGYEKGDFCYYRPHLFSETDLAYIEEVKKREKETWQTRETFDLDEIKEIPLIKAFGSYEEMRKLYHLLQKEHAFELSLIRDNFLRDFFVLMITDRQASKGKALETLLQMKGRGKKVIAAGDDENDLSMFAVADIRIVMEGAPPHVKEKADLIAPPADKLGIITALEQILKKL